MVAVLIKKHADDHEKHADSSSTHKKHADLSLRNTCFWYKRTGIKELFWYKGNCIRELVQSETEEVDESELSVSLGISDGTPPLPPPPPPPASCTDTHFSSCFLTSQRILRTRKLVRVVEGSGCGV